MNIAKEIPPVIFFGIFTSINGFLFYISKITAGESIAFFALCSVISLTLYFSSEIQELSIGGNIIKLKEVRRDADRAIAELQASRLIMFNFLLESTKKFSGVFANVSPKDERIDDFLFLCEHIDNFGLFDELADKIAGCAELYMKAQVYNCANYTNIDLERSYTPDELTDYALRSDNVRNKNEQYRKSILEAISYYRTLYNILKRTEHLTVT
ncbi:hypothetical protein [Atlantibacter hermannii]|uniref:hypothetical protein n=1 Tax=Atlantibacter hermannii TaxID=565 RepID=UPI0030763D53